MSVTIHRLNDRSRAGIVAHFLALPVADRSLRFGTPLARNGVTAYVEGIDLQRNALFGIQDEHAVLVGVAHVALTEDVAELGLSVLPAHRGLGLGGALFERAAAYARSRRIGKLLMRCLAGNAPIMRIARRFGMDIRWEDDHADASLRLLPAPQASVRAGSVTKTFPLQDRQTKALAAAH